MLGLGRRCMGGILTLRATLSSNCSLDHQLLLLDNIFESKISIIGWMGVIVCSVMVPGGWTVCFKCFLWYYHDFEISVSIRWMDCIKSLYWHSWFPEDEPQRCFFLWYIKICFKMDKKEKKKINPKHCPLLISVDRIGQTHPDIHASQRMNHQDTGATMRPTDYTCSTSAMVASVEHQNLPEWLAVS